jgi:hypothetical protein
MKHSEESIVHLLIGNDDLSDKELGVLLSELLSFGEL